MNALGIWIAIFLVVSLLIMFAPVMHLMYGEWKAGKERQEFPRFDERQRTIRCSAAIHALAAVLVYLVVWAVLDIFGVFFWTKESFAFAMLAVILAYGVWMGECILRDVAVGWSMQNVDSGQNGGVTLLAATGSLIGRWSEQIGLKIVAAALIVTGLVLSICNLIAVFRDEKRKKLAAMEEACEEE